MIIVHFFLKIALRITSFGIKALATLKAFGCLMKWFRHFIKHVDDNFDFLRLAQLKFRTNFLEEGEDDVIEK